MSDNLAIVLLAAGKSSRLGQPKQLVELDGKPLIIRQCELALSITKDVYCVLGFESELMADVIKHLPVRLVFNEEWHQGMSSSMMSGITALSDNVARAMILLVDQWKITASDLSQLIEASKNNPHCIIQSEFASDDTCGDNLKNETNLSKIAGPPAIFPKSFFIKLINSNGDQGGRTIVQQHKSSTIRVSIKHAGADLDTPEQLRTLII
jgi:molybdenum cofactor cytidylyltransferase